MAASQSQSAKANVELCCDGASSGKFRREAVIFGGGDGRMAIILAMAFMVVANRRGEKWSSWCRCFLSARF